MAIDNYHDLLAHAGHEIKCVTYAAENSTEPANVAIECETCSCVLLDYDRPVRFVALAVGESAENLRLVPLRIPPEDLHDGPHVAISRIARRDEWVPVTSPGGSWLVFFCEDFAAFDALWALANNPAGYEHLVEAAANLVSLLEDREISLTASDLVEPHNLLQGAVHEVKL